MPYNISIFSTIGVNEQGRKNPQLNTGFKIWHSFLGRAGILAAGHSLYIKGSG